jgi:hypothetical protein
MNDNVARVKTTLGSLRLLITKGTDIMFVSRHIDNFLDYVGEKSRAWLRGETSERLAQLAKYVEQSRAEVNYGIDCYILQNAFELLKPIVSAGYSFKFLPPVDPPIR